MLSRNLRDGGVLLHAFLNGMSALVLKTLRSRFCSYLNRITSLSTANSALNFHLEMTRQLWQGDDKGKWLDPRRHESYPPSTPKLGHSYVEIPPTMSQLGFFQTTISGSRLSTHHEPRALPCQATPDISAVGPTRLVLSASPVDQRQRARKGVMYGKHHAIGPTGTRP